VREAALDRFVAVLRSATDLRHLSAQRGVEVVAERVTGPAPPLASGL
jgi:hypothetical protein